MTAGQPVCVVETTKATVEVEAPGAGTIVQLYGEDVEVELGKTIAYVAESADELASIDAKAEEKPAPKPAAGERKATRKAVELAELHGIDLATVEKRGFITEKDVEELIDAQKAAAAPAAGPALAGVSTERRLAAGDLRSRRDRRVRSSRRPTSGSCASRTSSARCRPPRRSRRCASTAPSSATDVELGEGSLVVAPRIVISRTASSSARARRSSARRSFAIGELSPVRRRPRAALPPRLPRRGDLGRALGPDRRRRPPRSVGDPRDRRPRVRRRRGVRQRLPARC